MNCLKNWPEVLFQMSNDDLKFFGEDAVLDHIGIAVRSIDENLKNANKITDPVQRVRVAFMKLQDVMIELVEPIDDDSPVTRYLHKGNTLYHMCYRVPDINSAIKISREKGFHCIAKPVPAVAFNNRKIAWLFSKAYGLFELVEAE